MLYMLLILKIIILSCVTHWISLVFLFILLHYRRTMSPVLRSYSWRDSWWECHVYLCRIIYDIYFQNVRSLFICTVCAHISVPLCLLQVFCGCQWLLSSCTSVCWGWGFYSCGWRCCVLIKKCMRSKSTLLQPCALCSQVRDWFSLVVHLGIAVFGNYC